MTESISVFAEYNFHDVGTLFTVTDSNNQNWNVKGNGLHTVSMGVNFRFLDEVVVWLRENSDGPSDRTGGPILLRENQISTPDQMIPSNRPKPITVASATR